MDRAQDFSHVPIIDVSDLVAGTGVLVQRSFPRTSVQCAELSALPS
jgi:hypothetical protein